MTKLEAIALHRDLYERFINWYNLVTDENVSTDIEHYYTLPHDQWASVNRFREPGNIAATYGVLKSLVA